MTELGISRDLSLPVDAATGTFAILATKGAGKSNAGVVMAEEMWDAGVPWVAVDPKGDWWGVRSSANGKGPGLPITVFGGRHGDLPLEPTAGELIAQLVLEQRFSCVLDVSQFTKADTTRFLLAFGRHLFKHADDDEVEPIHLFLEEAHGYLPQSVKGDQAELVGMWQRIVKQGRFKGLGVTMISQRSSVLNKDVLELIDTLIVLRTIGPLSRKAIAAWVHDQDVDDGLLASLPGLKDGEAWIWSPGDLKIIERIRFRRRRTFDSGATPKVGEKRRTPTSIADVDLAALRDAMAETIEKAKADDPAELRKRIRSLEQQLATQKPEPVAVEVEVVPEWFNEFVVHAINGLETIQTASDDLVARITAAPAVKTSTGRATRQPQPRREPVAPARQPAPPTRRAAPAPASVPVDGDVHLKAGALRILQAIARAHPLVYTRSQIAVLAQMKKTGGTFGTYWSILKRAGYVIETTEGAPVQITDAGLDRAGVAGEEPVDVLEMWRSKLKAGAKKMLDYLVANPDWIDRADLAAAVDMEPSGGTFGTYLSILNRNGLVEMDGKGDTARVRVSELVL